MKTKLRLMFLPILVLGIGMGLEGCATTHKLTKPKGKWTAVNTVGFVPPNVTKYSEQPEPINQLTKKSKGGVKK